MSSFILRRHQCLCFSRGMVPVPMVGLRASQFGTALEVPPGELPLTPSPSDTYFSCGSKSTQRVRAATFWHVCLEMEPNPGACRRMSTERSLCAMRVGCSVTAILSRRRSILRPAILALFPRCCRGGFSTHCRLLVSFSRAYAGCGDTLTTHWF